MKNSEIEPSNSRVNRLFIRFAIFVAPLVLLAAATEYLWIAIPDVPEAKRRQVVELTPEIDTLILGSSTAFQGIDPRKIDGMAYNFAITNQTAYYHEKLLARMLPELPKLKRAIIAVGYNTLYFQFVRGGLDDYRQYQYQLAWGIPPRRTRDWLDLRMISHAAMISGGGVAGQIHQKLEAVWAHHLAIGMPQGAVDDRGWSRVIQHSSDLGAAAAAIPLSRQLSGMSEEEFEGSVAMLERMISSLRARHIDVVLVTFPATPSFSAGMRSDLWQRSLAVYQRLGRQPGVRYFNHLQTPELVPADFHDTDHLNIRGAVRFTSILNQELGSLH